MKIRYKSLRILFVAGIVSLLGFSLNGQDNFERRYPVQDFDVVTSDLDAVGSGYAILSTEVNTDGERDKVNLTFLDKKGTITRSISIVYGDSVLVKDAGEVITLSDGTFAISAVLDKDSLNKVISRLDNFGNHFWTVITGQESDLKTLPDSNSVLVDVPGDRIFHIGSVQGANSTRDLQLTSISYFGEIEFVKKLSLGSDLNEHIMQTHLALDSTILLVGTTDDPDAPLFVSKIDTSGNEIWTKTYNGDFGRTLAISEGYDIIQLIDSTWVVTGSVAPANTLRNAGFLIHMDNDGNPLRTETYSSISTRYQLYPSDVIGLLDTTVVLGLKRLDMTSDVVFPVLIHYDLDSTILYESLLDTCNSISARVSDMVTVDSMSATYLTTTTKDGQRIPFLGKVDEDGDSQCHESEDVVVIDSVAFTTNSINFDMEESMIEDSISVDLSLFRDFNPPILNLQDTTFCPQDPVIYIADARVRGAVAYVWEDGSTDSVRLIMEEGMYMVTVSVREDICFTLCDTLTISQLDFPMVDIAKNFDNYCSTGEGILLAEATGASISSFEWNTGSNEPFLVVDGSPATYSVTVADGCGNMADASAGVSDGDIDFPNPLGLELTDEDLCVDGTLRISATMQSDPGLISWSTGETNTLSISVSAPGTYTGNVGGFCPDMESIIVSEDDFLPEISGEITSECGNPLTLRVFGSGFASQRWSTSETTPFIEVNQPGNYSVTLIDECGDDARTLDIVVTEEEIDECTTCDNPCLIWPNAFHPLNGEVENQTFGPNVLDRCMDGLVSYELHIFNRWGKEIFTSNDVNVRWNGAVNGNNQPGGVYFYWAKYNDGNTTCEREGDLTLLR